LVNMNTEVSDKPADTFFRKETKVADFSITLVVKASRANVLIPIFTSKGT